MNFVKNIAKSEKILILKNCPSGMGKVVRMPGTPTVESASIAHKPPIKCVYNSQLCVADCDSLTPISNVDVHCLHCTQIDDLDRRLLSYQLVESS